MAAKPSKTKKKLSECTSPEEYLKMHGEEVDRVVRVWSAGDSDMLCETILYITPWNEPRTAVIRPEPGSEELTLVCRPGWDYFNPVYV